LIAVAVTTPSSFVAVMQRSDLAAES